MSRYIKIFIIMVVITISGIFAANAETVNILWDENFENETEFAEKYITAENTCIEICEDENGTNALRIENHGEEDGNIYINLENFGLPKKTGIAEISLDVKVESFEKNFGSFFNIRYNDESLMTRTRSYCTNFYMEEYTWAGHIFTEENKYYKIKFLIDFDNMKMTEYWNDKVRMSMPIKDEAFKDIAVNITKDIYGDCDMYNPDKSLVMWIDNIYAHTMSQQIVSTVPVNGGKTSVKTEISAVFSAFADKKNITREHITIEENGRKFLPEEYRVMLASDQKTVKIVPVNGLKANSTYSVIISKDAAGIEEDYIFGFTTIGENEIYREEFEAVEPGTKASAFIFNDITTDKASAVVAKDAKGTKAIKLVDSGAKDVTLNMELSKLGISAKGKLDISMSIKIESFTKNFGRFMDIRYENGDFSPQTFSYLTDLYTFNGGWDAYKHIDEGNYYNIRLELDFDNMTITEYWDNAKRITVDMDNRDIKAVTFNISTDTRGGGSVYNSNKPFVMWIDDIAIEMVTGSMDSQTDGVIYNEDFESAAIGTDGKEFIFCGVNGDIDKMNVQQDENGTKAMRIEINSTGISVLEMLFENMNFSNTGTAEITFDFKIDSWKRDFHRFFDVIYSNNNEDPRTFSYLTDLYEHNWSGYYHVGTGAYNKYKLVIDYDNSVIYEYINDYHRATNAMQTSEIKCLTTHMQCGGYGGENMYEQDVPHVMWIDNIKITGESSGIVITDKAGNSIKTLSNHKGEVLKVELNRPEDTITLLVIKNTDDIVKDVYIISETGEVAKNIIVPDEEGEEYKIEFYNINNLKNIKPVEEKITYGG